MTSVPYWKEWRQKRKEFGLCVVCGKLSEGKTRCQECRKKDAERQKERQQKLIAAGICKTCGKAPAGQGHLYCDECLAKANRSSRKSAAKRKREGRCNSCGVDCNGFRCEDCRLKTNEATALLRRKRKRAGLCRDCGGEAQLIDRTGQHHAPGGKRTANYCRECFFKMTAGYVLGSGKRWQELVGKLDLFDWRCVYTGEALILGENLSFDHANPVCRFPEQKGEIENIEPVTLTVNLMKRHMTKREFLDLTEAITRHAQNRSM